jgi:hypothetical protein
MVVLLNPDISGLPAATNWSNATLVFISAVVNELRATCAVSVAARGMWVYFNGVSHSLSAYTNFFVI